MAKLDFNFPFIHLKDKRINHDFSREDIEKSRVIRSLRKEIKALDELLDLKDGRIDEMMKDLKVYYGQKDENKMWDIVERFLTPASRMAGGMKTESGELVPTSNIDLSDDQIENQLSQFTKKQISETLKLGDSTVKNLIRSQLPSMSETTVEKGLQIAKRMVGK